jgi:hypothetical protein
MQLPHEPGRSLATSLFWNQRPGISPSAWIDRTQRGLSPPIGHQITRRDSIDGLPQLQASGDNRSVAVSQKLKRDLAFRHRSQAIAIVEDTLCLPVLEVNFSSNPKSNRNIFMQAGWFLVVVRS